LYYVYIKSIKIVESKLQEITLENIKTYLASKHTLLPEEPLTIPGKDGDDAPLYLEKNIRRAIKKLEELENQDREESEE
jgi:hypothetical protein